MKFSVQRLHRPLAICVLSATVLLTACAHNPAGMDAVIAPTYDELMTSGEEAQRKGGIVEALALYEKAAKADPAKKQPWGRIAQAQFDARNYGAAITAAQEVLLRDTTDVTAKSIMAVSGLRVSAGALEQLREANALGGNTREEAQTLARIMREALGESILPAPQPTAQAPDKPTPRARRLPAPRAPAATTSPPAEPKRNPFDALKG